MPEKGYQLSEEAARRTAEAVRRVETMHQGRRGYRPTMPRGGSGGGSDAGGGRIVSITSATKDANGYQDATIASYQSGSGTAIKFYNFNTSQPALPLGFYHAEKLTSAPAGSPTVDVYGAAYTAC